MKVKESELKGVLEIEPDVFEDNRGYLFENFNFEKLKEHGISGSFPLEFQSMSKKGVIRGLHFQKKPFAQGKLVRVVRGSALDIVADLRKNSKTYGKWKSFSISDKNKKMVWVPEGFAHGFLSLEDNTIMCYKLTNVHSKEHQAGIIWDDPDLKIDWKLKDLGIKQPELSERDQKHPKFKDLEGDF